MNYFDKANDLYNVKDYRKAIDMYNLAVINNDNEPSSLYNASVCYIKLKEYEKAIPLLKLAISKKMESKYFFNLGYSYTMLENFKKALIYFNMAWSLDNHDSDCEKAINLIMKKIKK